MTARVEPTALARALRELLDRLEAPIAPVSDAVERLLPFVSLVAAWNTRTNLTAARTAAEYAEILCVDALVAAGPAFVPRRSRLVDVGSGGGAPAIPLVLLREDVEAVLVEPLRKRVAFLRTAIGSLGLEERVRVVEGRVDPEAPRVPGAPFDVALSRATFAPRTWVHVGSMLAPRVLCFLGAERLEAYGGLDERARAAYALPHGGSPRALIALGE